MIIVEKLTYIMLASFVDRAEEFRTKRERTIGVLVVNSTNTQLLVSFLQLRCDLMILNAACI